MANRLKRMRHAAPGAMPHPPHRHVHSEMFLLREGTLELTVNGKTYRWDRDRLVCASNEEHGVKNVGERPANLFVVEWVRAS